MNFINMGMYKYFCIVSNVKVIHAAMHFARKDCAEFYNYHLMNHGCLRTCISVGKVR